MITVTKSIVYTLDSQNRILVMRRMRGGVLLFPGGTVLAGESPMAAAGRELREESGLDEFSIVTLLAVSDYDMRPLWNEVHHRYFYYARYLGKPIENWSVADEFGEKFVLGWSQLRDAHYTIAGMSTAIGSLAEAITNEERA